MNLEKFEHDMRVELRALTNIAKDLEELAENADGYRMQQEIYGKAERVYCAMMGYPLRCTS